MDKGESVLNNIYRLFGILLFIFISGCDFPAEKFHTDKYGILVIVHGDLIVIEKQVSEYIDAAEESLRKQGVKIDLSIVHLYEKGHLRMYRDGAFRKVSGMAFLNAPWLGLWCVWYYTKGATAYAHERLHQDGYSHNDINDTNIDENAKRAGYKAAFDPL